MKKKTALIVIAIIICLGLAIGVVFLFWRQDRETFAWQYMIIDDTRWQSTLDDGGSSTNIYYQINLDERQVRKCEDKYSGPMQNYEYKEKVIYQKEFDDKLAAKLDETLNKLWQAGDEKEGNYSFYIIEKSGDGARYIQNKAAISQLQAFAEKFNKLSAGSDTAE